MTAYIVADIEILDQRSYDDYRSKVPAIIAAHGGRYLVRAGAYEVLEGTWRPRRYVVIEFPTMAALRAFYDSDDYRALRTVRERAARSSIVAFEGA
jgi:uncharacterized protein (DUF1330 family)